MLRPVTRTPVCDVVLVVILVAFAACRAAAPLRPAPASAPAPAPAPAPATDPAAAIVDPRVDACALVEGSWRCPVAPGLTARVEPVLGPTDSAGERRVEALEVTLSGEVGALVRLPLPAASRVAPPRAGDVAASDLDADGHRDLRLRAAPGVNAPSHTWRWLPAESRFAYDSVLSTLPNLYGLREDCVRSIDVDPSRHEDRESHYCRRDGQWVEVERREWRYDDATSTYVETRWRLVGRRMVRS